MTGKAFFLRGFRMCQALTDGRLGHTPTFTVYAPPYSTAGTKRPSCFLRGGREVPAGVMRQKASASSTDLRSR